MLFIESQLFAQQPVPTPAQLEERLQAKARAMIILGQRELEITELFALYANRVDKLTEENARLHIQIDATPACPPQPEPPKEGTQP